MKRLNWVLIGVVILCLAIVPLLGGCVAKSKYEALQADYQALQADYDALNADYQAASSELADIKAVYPPRDFESYSELSEWANKHIKPERSTADKWYGEALKVQEEALTDGYIVSANISDITDYSTGWTGRTFLVCNTAVAGGTLYWWDPSIGELWQYPIIVYK